MKYKIILTTAHQQQIHLWCDLSAEELAHINMRYDYGPPGHRSLRPGDKIEVVEDTNQ